MAKWNPMQRAVARSMAAHQMLDAKRALYLLDDEGTVWVAINPNRPDLADVKEKLSNSNLRIVKWDGGAL